MTQIDALKTDEIQNYEIEHQEEVHRLAGECMVILENDGVFHFRLVQRRLHYSEQEQDIRSKVEQDPVM